MQEDYPLKQLNILLTGSDSVLKRDERNIKPGVCGADGKEHIARFRESVLDNANVRTAALGML